MQSHRNIFKVIETIRNEHLKKAFLINQLLAGHRPQPPKSKVAQRKEMVKRIVQNYAQYEPLDFLRRVSYHVKF